MNSIWIRSGFGVSGTKRAAETPALTLAPVLDSELRVTDPALGRVGNPSAIRVELMLFGACE